MSLRVAIVTESFLPSTNGVTNSVVKILESLRSEGHEALLITPTTTADRFEGFPVIRTNRLYFRGFPVALPLINMTSVLRSFRPDVVHVAAPFWLGNQTLRVCKRLGIPTVAVYQTDIAGYASRYGLGVLRQYGSWLTKRILGKATLSLAPTTKMAEYLKSLGLSRVAVWGRGVDHEQFNPRNRGLASTNSFKKAHGLNDGVIVGFVGRLAPEKQVHRFGELFGIAGLKFLIVGDGVERVNLERVFHKQPAVFTGVLRGRNLANAYASMDIFLHCGTEETFGQTIQEAQAAGLPVIAPARGGPVTLIKDGVTGLLVEPSEPDCYRDAVLRLIGNPELRITIGENARKAVLDNSWQHNNAKLFDYYEVVAGKVD